VSNTDFAAAAAMAKDILAVGPTDSPETADSEREDEAVTADQPDVRPDPPEGPMAPDFFTTSRPKKKFWRLK
jgi:hypothetical protein